VTRNASAGVLLYRRGAGSWEVFLVHPGGPFWRNKDAGAWSIPKGGIEPGETPVDAARREFHEETGCAVSGELTPLQPVRQAGGKIVHAFAVEGDCDAEAIRSGTYSLEWPPRSGGIGIFPEVDRAAWFGLDDAAVRISKGQRGLLVQLRALLRSD
jgi:predicted NUDIX family NTP pyrophosphohydrolase